MDNDTLKDDIPELYASFKKMNILYSQIVPFVGTDCLSLDMTYDETKQYLRNSGIKYKVDVVSNKGCTPEVPWDIMRIGDSKK